MRRPFFALAVLIVFFTSASTAQTISLTPSSCRQFQTRLITIAGQGANFKSSPVGIVFYLDANDSFYAVPNAFVSQSKMTAYVSVPDVVPGLYDVRIVDTLTDSVLYSAAGSFEVALGWSPYISMVPDSGAAGTNFDATIVGSNTFFNASANNSQLNSIEVDLTAFDSNYFSAFPSKVVTDSAMTVLFVLPDELPAGYYVARVHTLGIEPAFDFSSNFLVKPVPVITLPNANSGQAGRTVSVDVLVQGSPIPGPNPTAYLAPAGNHTTLYADQSFSLTGNSTFTAVFDLPPTLTPGPYDLLIVAFADLTITGKSVFTVLPYSSVDENAPSISNIVISPNPAEGYVNFKFYLPKSMYARLSLFDAHGRKVSTLCDGVLNCQQSIDWDSDNVPNGSYFYELDAGDQVYHGRIVIQH